jgi:predicted amidophosphoribosyltransferase
MSPWPGLPDPPPEFKALVEREIQDANEGAAYLLRLLAGARCRGCGGPRDEYTPGCRTCGARHRQRRVKKLACAIPPKPHGRPRATHCSRCGGDADKRTPRCTTCAKRLKNRAKRDRDSALDRPPQ